MVITVTQLLKYMRKKKAQKHDIDAVVYWKTQFNKSVRKKEIESTQPHFPLADVSGNEVEVCCKTCYFYDGNCSNPNICINHSEWKQTYR